MKEVNYREGVPKMSIRDDIQLNMRSKRNVLNEQKEKSKAKEAIERTTNGHALCNKLKYDIICKSYMGELSGNVINGTIEINDRTPQHWPLRWYDLQGINRKVFDSVCQPICVNMSFLTRTNFCIKRLGKTFFGKNYKYQVDIPLDIRNAYTELKKYADANAITISNIYVKETYSDYDLSSGHHNHTYQHNSDKNNEKIVFTSEQENIATTSLGEWLIDYTINI